jgi:ElaB/YqjD/DUF883 family membrane-anchored ribosome-binding protein
MKAIDSDTVDIAADFAALRKDVAKLVDTVAVLAQQQAEGAQAKVNETVTSARNKLADTAADTQRRLRSTGNDLEASIGRNPLAAMLIAMGVGFSLALLSQGGRTK